MEHLLTLVVKYFLEIPKLETDCGSSFGHVDER